MWRCKVKGEKAMSMIDVKTALNDNIGVDLIAISQYFFHARVLKHWGYEKLGSLIYKRSIEVMRFSDDLIQRLFLLEGLPNLQRLGKLLVGENVLEVLACDLVLEHKMHTLLIEGISICDQNTDFVSRKILTKHLAANEAHINVVKENEKLVEVMGKSNYLELLI